MSEFSTQCPRCGDVFVSRAPTESGVLVLSCKVMDKHYMDKHSPEAQAVNEAFSK